MAKVILKSWGGTEKLFADELTHGEAYELCDSYNFEWESPDNGYVWDMWIESTADEEEAWEMEMRMKARNEKMTKGDDRFYKATYGLYVAYKMMEGLTDDGVFVDDGKGIDAKDCPSCEWWYSIDEGYCPTQDRTYLTVELKIGVEDNETPIWKVLPIGWYQGEPSAEETKKYVGELIGTFEY